jgi:hypothetical protein
MNTLARPVLPAEALPVALPPPSPVATPCVPGGSDDAPNLLDRWVAAHSSARRLTSDMHRALPSYGPAPGEYVRQT